MLGWPVDQHEDGRGGDQSLGVVARRETGAGHGHDPQFFVGEIGLVLDTHAGGRQLGRLAIRPPADGRGVGGSRLDLNLGRGDARRAVVGMPALLQKAHPVGRPWRRRPTRPRPAVVGARALVVPRVPSIRFGQIARHGDAHLSERSGRMAICPGRKADGAIADARPGAGRRRAERRD
jgi:hypothetical protein